MSAPLVDAETKKLGLKPEKKAYVNLWFRHTIFPVYPISQLLIVTAALTEITIPLIILRHIPVVAVMIVVGYVISFWGVSNVKNDENLKMENRLNLDWKGFFVAFSPILTTIVVAVGLDLVGFGLAKLGFDVLIATFIGLVVLIAVSKMNLQVFVKPFRSWGIYGITLAAYGAFLLKNVMIATGIPEILKAFVTNGSVDIILLLTVVPAVLGFLTGSALGGVTISVPILYGILTTFSPRTAALVYMGAYLGYLITPTHLCFAFTADYFKSSLGKIYKYLIPSIAISFATAIIVYFLI